MSELCIPFVLQAKVYNDEKEARQHMLKFFPKLKRWA